MADKFTYNEETANTNYPLYGDNWVAQTFSHTEAYEITYVELRLERDGVGGNVTVSIRATDGAGKPTGADLCVTAAIDCSDATTATGGAWEKTFTFTSAYDLSANTTYAIVARCDSTLTNAIRWSTDTSSPTYANGETGTSDDAGSSWTLTAYDTNFRAYGNLITEPADKFYSKALVAIAANELWYESAAGTMSELSAANGEMNVNDPIMAVEAYQKVFIVNKTNLKVADFINIKINTTDAGANPCHKGNTLTGGTSTAKMIVDYVDGVTDDSAMNVYGYRTTSATFSSGETVTGTNDNAGAISFVLSAAETAGPHWYDWTVFGNDTTNYGTMPTSSTLIALYRGRIVINDVQIPHAWFMFKVGDPWKIKYDYTNDGDLSAVTHTNTIVGKIGDIITALIPYKDDLLIFGCANSIWILVGDALGSGQLARITNTTGIWGAKAWCIDDKSNLYFLGEDGIYRMPISESYSPPENISRLSLPNLVADLDLDKSLHRIVLGFDPIDYGITISKTLLSDGTSTNYWFSLLTQGFYPETYPTSCGVFSAYYYPATDDTYKKFLVGCNDGYIREFDVSTKNDATTSSTSAIDSYFAVIQQLSEDEDRKGRLTWINAITAGGASGGDFGDTDSIAYSLSVANDAETCLEDIKDGATAFTTGTWSGTGKQTKNRTRMEGAWAGIKLRNNTASETWGINKIYGELKAAGRLK